MHPPELLAHCLHQVWSGGAASGRDQVERSGTEEADEAAVAEDWAWRSGAPGGHAQVGHTADRAWRSGAAPSHAQDERSETWIAGTAASAKDWAGKCGAPSSHVQERTDNWARSGGATRSHAQVERSDEWHWSGGAASDHAQVERAGDWAWSGGVARGHAQVERTADWNRQGSATSDHVQVERSVGETVDTAAVAEEGAQSGGAASSHAQAERGETPEPAYFEDIGPSEDEGAFKNDAASRAKRPRKRACPSYSKRAALHETAWKVVRDMQADPTKNAILAQGGFCSYRSVRTLRLWGKAWLKQRWGDRAVIPNLKQEAERLESALLQRAQSAGPESEPRPKRQRTGDEVVV